MLLEQVYGFTCYKQANSIHVCHAIHAPAVKYSVVNQANMVGSLSASPLKMTSQTGNRLVNITDPFRYSSISPPVYAKTVRVRTFVSDYVRACAKQACCLENCAKQACSTSKHMTGLFRACLSNGPR